MRKKNKRSCSISLVPCIAITRRLIESRFRRNQIKIESIYDLTIVARLSNVTLKSHGDDQTKRKIRHCHVRKALYWRSFKKGNLSKWRI